MAQYKRYPKEFKLDAVRLVLEQGYSLKEAGEKLGVSSWSVGEWIRKFRGSGELDVMMTKMSSGDELHELRKENRQLRLEVEILKKAAAYFAKESL
jgi:transposase